MTASHLTRPAATDTDVGPALDAAPESAWFSHPAWSGIPVLDVSRVHLDYDRVVVVAAHPDDETLGVGGLIADLSDAGVRVDLIVATDGEASHPHASVWTQHDIARRRREEIRDAFHLLAPGGDVHLLDVPDGGVCEHHEMLARGLAGILRESDLVLAPSPRDGHPDHDALGDITAEAAAHARSTIAHYLVWAWAWRPPESMPWESAIAVEPSLEAMRRRRSALEVFRSQILPLGPGAGDAPILGPDDVVRADRIVELLFAGDPGHELPVLPRRRRHERQQPFDALFCEEQDPWELRSSHYERRKRDLTTAVLGRPRYDRILELGCATGLLTRALAARAGRVVAMDVSAQALRQAVQESPSHVEWVQGAAPEDIPEETFDLVVISELGYYLTPVEWIECLRRARSCLADGGEILLAHWQHPTEDIPLDGAAVHAHARLALDLPRRARYEDADLLLEVWGDPVSVHEAGAR